ncbi:hypothetical protein KUF54_01400 [Comamonas sp. Y33R10-2]|uniref:hypothetical protein n=1 Tax=Comamonas sp. Y33R10-2 TaxID=2853257 RepID=UPI001C5CADE2|nr:hypothetical protein [Comamonas sp. Y33R10-2]QXZ09957.1 hypothetical protein KUF54_01400 [Comamonas sp. Y33R10-2]
MSTAQYSPEIQAMLAISAQHLLNEGRVQQYQQLWIAAQSSGNRAAQQAVRQHVVAAGRQLQGQRANPQARALWLALMSLRCSMLMPRLRF